MPSQDTKITPGENTDSSSRQSSPEKSTSDVTPNEDIQAPRSEWLRESFNVGGDKRNKDD